MNYRWINVCEIPDVNECQIVLFGAGAGSEEFLDFLIVAQIKAQVLFVADNDSSIYGKSFNGYKIIAPERIKEYEFDKIIVTSVSGRDVISNQLDAMGFKRNVDYFTVGRYPVTTNASFELLKNFGLCDQSVLKGSTWLTIGPGGNLGLEILLYCFGADRVFSIDKHRFGINYPEINDSVNAYDSVREYCTQIEDECIKNYALERFETLFINKHGKCFIDEDKIKFLYPMDVCKLSFEDNKFDFVFSSGVLEHVERPDSAVFEIMRVLKKGGVTLNRIITRDHRSFSKSSGCHAFSFRNYMAEAWDEISLRKFYQNRVLPVEWKKFFIKHGMLLDVYKIEEEMELDDSIYEEFNSDFHNFSRSELGEINCVITGKRM